MTLICEANGGEERIVKPRKMVRMGKLLIVTTVKMVMNVTIRKKTEREEDDTNTLMTLKNVKKK